MEKFYKRCASHLFIITALIASSPFAVAQKGPTVEQGLVRVKFSEELSSQIERTSISLSSSGTVVTGVGQLDRFNQQYDVKKIKRVFREGGKYEARHRKYGLHRWYELTMDKKNSVLQAISSYQSLIQVEKAEPVYKKTIVGSRVKNFGPVVFKEKNNPVTPILSSASNDPMLASQWHYNNTGQTGGTAGADIRLFNAWKKETGKRTVIVAIIDGGIQSNHPDLAANMWSNSGEINGNHIDDDLNGFIDDNHGFSFVDNTGDISEDHHGTHVAGTIAAVTNNGIGVAGIAGGSGSGDGVRLMSCAVFSDTGSEGFPEAYLYAADNGALISQNSWGYTEPGAYEQAVLEAIDYFIAEAGTDENGNQTGLMKGGLVIFAAGNSSGNDAFYPGYYAPTFSVASTTHQDKKAWYSNYGSWVDIAAPGGETDNEEPQGVLSTLAGNQYGYFQGTSMACPHVSGVAALIISKYGKPGFKPEMVQNRLRYSSTPIDGLNSSYIGKLGAGRIDASASLLDTDNTPPAAITNLSVVKSEVGKITLSWKVPSDQGGFVSQYDIRYSTSPITASNFSSAKGVTNPPAPQSSGTTQTFTVTGLASAALYYFAMKSIDFQGNASPISNVAHKTSALSPTIAVTPITLTENLKTAQTSTRTFTIKNAGRGVLEFVLKNASEVNDHASCSPAHGTIAADGSKVITVVFSAKNLFTGTYQKDLIIESNDPAKSSLKVPITLNVTNNNLPIATFQPTVINFKSVQKGTSSRREVTIQNSGSNTLIIDRFTASNIDFRADFSGTVSIPPFSERIITLLYSPSTLGNITGSVSLYTNDPSKPALKINVSGEGITKPPVVAIPNIIQETLDQGTTSSRVVKLQNNGSYNRTYKIEIVTKDSEISTFHESSSARSAKKNNTPTSQMMEKHRTALARQAQDVDPLLHSIKSNVLHKKVDRIANGRIQNNAVDYPSYKTGFENFSKGSVNDQENWFAMDGWLVESVNPSSGAQHLHGVSSTPGQSSFSISPSIFEEQEEYSTTTSTSMRVDASKRKGTVWQIVPQDPFSYVVTRIRFNADGSVDAMSVDENYEVLWTPITAEVPEGYFDLAVELDGMGDGTSGFPVFDIYFNSKKVFRGWSLGAVIGEVAFQSQTNAAGPSFDIDDLSLKKGEFIPDHIYASPVTGNLPAGSSVDVTLTFDATNLRSGTYLSDIVTYLDDVDKLTIPATVTVNETCKGKGTLQQEVWANVTGKLVSSIPVGSPPSSINTLHLFEIPYNAGDNYGSRIRGYLCVPVTGDYTFWIASDDHSELWLSTDDSPNHKVKIASVTGYTLRREWEKYPSQKSQAIHLIAGNKYYVEALHKDATGSDHLAVGWQLPDGTLERPIGENRIIPFDQNVVPFVNISDPSDGDQFAFPATFTITAEAGDSDGTITKVEYYQNNVKITEDDTAPYQVLLNDLPAGRYEFTARAIDDLGGTASSSITIDVNAVCSGTGKILWDFWPGIAGTSVSAIPVNTPPGVVTEITSFETPTYYENNYGARLRGYLCVPATGDYTFWIASDDNSELWLSTDNDRSNKIKIANVPGTTKPRQWDKYPSQKSLPIHLVAGYQYYVEALHKEATGNDHVAVGWQLPDGTFEGPIPGIRLSPSANNGTTERAEQNVFEAAASINDNHNEITLHPNPTTQGLVTLQINGEDISANQASIEIISATGKIVYRDDILCEGNCNTITFEIGNDFASGIYVVNVLVNGKRYAKRLVVN